MTLNDILTKQNLLTKITLAKNGQELSKELKVKIMRMRMTFNKIKKQFDEDAKAFSEQLITDELRELANKTDRTESENAKFTELNNKANSEYQEYLIQKGNEVVNITIDLFTEAEYADILDLNSEGEVTINNQTVNMLDLMEAFYEYLVQQ